MPKVRINNSRKYKMPKVRINNSRKYKKVYRNSKSVNKNE